MKKLLIFLLVCCPIVLVAQVPKAFNNEFYTGKLHGRLIKFTLADGYPDYSIVKLLPPGKGKPIKFEPESGSIDDNDRMKFITHAGRTDYFLLNNILETYDEIPDTITGIYYSPGDTVAIKLKHLTIPDRKIRHH